MLKLCWELWWYWLHYLANNEARKMCFKNCAFPLWWFGHA